LDSVSGKPPGCATEVKRLKQVELAVADDPLARQTAIEDQGGGL
jgi:hypothetical protein